jgi:hypothetical protein
MFSDTDAPCVAIGLAVCLQKRERITLNQRMVQTKTTIHTQKPHGRFNVE